MQLSLGSTCRWVGLRSGITAAVLGLGLLLSVGACATVQRQGGREVCMATEVLHVRNETPGPIEVYSVRGSIESLLGTAGAGATEFPLPPRAAGEFWTFIGRTPSGGYIRAGGAGSRLDFRVLCR